MSRRKRKEKGILSLIAILIVAWLVLEFIRDNLALVRELIFATAIIGALAYLGIILFKNRARSRMLEDVSSIINQHIENLSRKRWQSVRKDAYGKDFLDKWNHEIDYFINVHIHPALTPKQQRLMDSARPEIRNTVIQRTEAFISPNQVFKPLSDSVREQGLEFEAFCAEQLSAYGWTARVTRATGDQGIDVIAEKHGVRVILQCKWYSGAVGNDAVQEIFGAKNLERANYCAVVSNRGYTSAAEQLAAVNDVRLLHYSDLHRLDKLLGLETGSSVDSPEGFPSSEPTGIIAGLKTKMLAFEAFGREANASSRMHLGVIASAVLVAFAALTFILRHDGNRAVAMADHYSSRPVADGYTRYSNERFGYSIDFPTFFVRRVVLNVEWNLFLPTERRV